MSETMQDSAWKRLSGTFQHYRNALARSVARIVRPGDVEDIVQETYVRLFQAAQRQPIRHPKSFMLKVARNLALSHVAGADAMNHLANDRLPGDEESESGQLQGGEVATESPEELAQAQEEFLIFCRAIRELPVKCQRAFLLRKVYSLSQRQVARELGISESTVEKHIAKGIVMCSGYMAANGYARPDGVAGVVRARRRRGAA